MQTMARLADVGLDEKHRCRRRAFFDWEVLGHDELRGTQKNTKSHYQSPEGAQAIQHGQWAEIPPD